MKLKKGDKVKILLGKDRGKEGAIERISYKKAKVWIPGINVYKRSLKADALKRQGGTNAKGQIIDIIKPLDVSNLALICPNCNKPTRVGIKVRAKERLRICKKCKKEIAGKVANT